MKALFKNGCRIIWKNKWFLIGLVLVVWWVFSNYAYGYQLSFTNINYTFAPFNTTGTATDGPLLSDIADSHYPSIFAAYYEKNGLNLWESDVSLGRTSGNIPFLMNPLEWLHVLPLSVAIFLKAFSEFALAFYFMYLFLRSLNVGKFAAAMGGSVYAFSAVIVVWLGWPHSDVAAMAPLLFFAIERLIATVKIRYALLIALVVYIMLMAGMPTYAAYFLYLAGVYIVIFTLKKHWGHAKTIFAVGGLFAFGIVLAAVASLPYTYTLLGNVAANGYMDSRAALAKASLSIPYLRTMLYPYIRDGLTMHVNETTLYAGLASVVFLPLALFRPFKKKRNLFFLASVVVLFLLIFTDTLNAVYTKLPLINTSLKFRVITLFTFSLAVLTGISIDDVVRNREQYKYLRWLAWPVVSGWSMAVFYKASIGIWPTYAEDKKAVMISMALIGLSVLLMMFVKSKRKFINGCLCLLCAVVVLRDGALFAHEYLPWIDREASVIPEPTDSVEYLMENTQDEVRIAGIGGWVLFPNTPALYDLNDIRSHGFEMTNADIQKYYTAIDSTIYSSATRTEIKKIDNYPLLQYLGVKYVYGPTVGRSVSLEGDSEIRKVFGTVESGSTVSQKIVLEDNMFAMKLLFATYGTVPQSDGTVTLALVSQSDGMVVYEASVAVKDIRDNVDVNFVLPENVTIPAGEYTLSLTFDNLENDAITIWMEEKADSTVYSEYQTVDGSMVIQAMYSEGPYQAVYTGKDSMMIATTDAYTDKAELVETSLAFEDQESVLAAMAEAYLDNTAFLVKDDATLVYDKPLENGEGVEIVEYTDDYVKLQYTSYSERYVTLNDYYDENWTVYVNGQKTELEKANYFMRAVKVDAGDNVTIEFQYEPRSYYIVTGVSLAVILFGVLLFIFAKKPQELLDKLLFPENATAMQAEEFCKTGEQVTFVKDTKDGAE